MDIKKKIVSKLAPKPFEMVGNLVKRGMQKAAAPIVAGLKKEDAYMKARDAKFRQQGADLKAGRELYK